jgi:hypothetical protein
MPNRISSEETRMIANTSPSHAKDVPIAVAKNVPLAGLGHSVLYRRHIRRQDLQSLAFEKYNSSGKGITFEDIQLQFHCTKRAAQRTLKHFHGKQVIFTAKDLTSQGTHVPPTMRNEKPQRYYPTFIKSDILEHLKKKGNVQIQPGGQPPITASPFQCSGIPKSTVIF